MEKYSNKHYIWLMPAAVLECWRSRTGHDYLETIFSLYMLIGCTSRIGCAVVNIAFKNRLDMASKHETKHKDKIHRNTYRPWIGQAFDECSQFPRDGFECVGHVYVYVYLKLFFRRWDQSPANRCIHGNNLYVLKLFCRDAPPSPERQKLYTEHIRSSVL